MRKRIGIGILTTVFALGWLAQAYAQLIDWNKRKRALKYAHGKEAEELKRQMPAWVLEMPKVKTDEEERYDVNEDGYLQLAEVKIYLRDVIDEVERRGGVEVNNGLLVEYDKNRDRVINRQEAELIAEHVR